MNGDIVIQAEGLNKSYGTTRAVKDVDLTVRQGEILGLVGPNGAGKTTLLRILSTLLVPTSGHARVFGLDLHTGYLDIRCRLGYLPDFFNLYRNLTVDECLRFFAHAYHVAPEHVESRITLALDAVGLPGQHHTIIHHLSRGMVQRLGMAVLMARDAELLILDEPASGLDPRARVELRELLKTLGRTGKTILISSHILSDLADACTHIAIMDQGCLVRHGPVNEIVNPAGKPRRVRFRLLGVQETAIQQIIVESRFSLQAEREGVVAEINDSADIADINAQFVHDQVKVVGIEELRDDLESVFLRMTKKTEGGVECP